MATKGNLINKGGNDNAVRKAMLSIAKLLGLGKGKRERENVRERIKKK
ncbi:MAG: hypothetical protein LBL39_00085 [Planctomycetaceae bacterium]|nr:hypothetical protein [Planctomycetaceae bacterium]